MHNYFIIQDFVSNLSIRIFVSIKLMFSGEIDHENISTVYNKIVEYYLKLE